MATETTFRLKKYAPRNRSIVNSDDSNGGVHNLSRTFFVSKKVTCCSCAPAACKEVPAFSCGFFFLYASFGLLFTFYYGGLAPYKDSDARPVGGEIFESQSKRTVSGIDKLTIHNPFYTAGDRLSGWTAPARVLGIAFYPTTSVSTFPGDSYEEATGTLFFPTGSAPFGELQSAGSAPAYGKLQALASQFMHVESLAYMQTHTACGMNGAVSPLSLDHSGAVNVTLEENGTFSDAMWVPAGGWYCRFLEERAESVSLWFRTVLNTYHLGFYVLCGILYLYFFRVIFELGIFILKWCWRPDSRASRNSKDNEYAVSSPPTATQTETQSELYAEALQTSVWWRGVFRVHVIYTLTSYGAEAIWLEEMMWMCVVSCLFMVRMCLNESIVMAFMQGPDLMGYKAAESNPAINLTAGLHPGQVFMSLDSIEEAQSCVNMCIVFVFVHVVCRGLFYYPAGTYFNATTEVMNTLLRKVFGKAAPNQFGQEHEVASLPCSLVCFPCCCLCFCNKEYGGGKRCTRFWSFLWVLRGSMRYSIFVLVTVFFAFFLSMFITPAIYVDGLRSSILFSSDSLPGAGTSLSLSASRSEVGGYCLADVLGYDNNAERQFLSAGRNGYQDFQQDTLEEAIGAAHFGLTFEMYSGLAEVDAMASKNLPNGLHRTQCMYCAHNSEHATAVIRESSQLRMRSLRLHAPQAFGLSVYLRYNAQLAEIVISSAMYYTFCGFWIIVLLVLVCIVYMRRSDRPDGSTAGNRMLCCGESDERRRTTRGICFFLQNVGEMIGHALVIGSMLVVIFLAVRPAELTRDTLVAASTSGVNLMSSSGALNQDLLSKMSAGLQGQSFMARVQSKLPEAQRKYLPSSHTDLNDAIAAVAAERCTDSDCVRYSPKISSSSFLATPDSGATAWQSAIAMGLSGMSSITSDSSNSFAFDESAISHEEAVGDNTNSRMLSARSCAQRDGNPGTGCVLSKLTFFRDEAFGTHAASAENPEEKRKELALIDSVWRSMCRPRTSFFYNHDTFQVDNAPRLTTQYQNDIRLWCILMVLLSVAHVMLYSMLFVPLMSFNYPKSALSHFLEFDNRHNKNEPVLMTGEAVPLLPHATVNSAYEPTQLRMTGIRSVNSAGVR